MKLIRTLILLFLAASANTFAQSAVASTDVVVNPLPFNSSDDDFAPFFMQGGRLLYFTSNRDGEQQIYMVPRTASGWGDVDALPDEINRGEHIGVASVTPDGQYMVFAAYGRAGALVGRTDLYSAHKVNGQWTDVQNLGADVNSDAWDSQPFISADGNTLYFVSDRSGGSGGTDIYMSRRTPQGWSSAVNLGGNINSPSDEVSPALAADNERMYFASNRPGGMGGFDVYTINLPKPDGSTRAANIGAPVNTEADELFYFSIANSNQAFFTSNRSGGEGALDLYAAVPDPVPGKPVLIVRGTVKNAVTKAPVGSMITITDLQTARSVAQFQSDDVTGEYFVMLTPGREYSVTASKAGYLFYSERFEVPADETGREVTYDISLSPVHDGSVRLLVFFDFDKADLRPESRSELDRVVEFLQGNPDIKVSIEGHTDDQGTTDYNKGLSERRAKSVEKYLIAGGVPAARVSSAGFGKNKPLMQGTSDEARARNRRVEMRIVR